MLQAFLFAGAFALSPASGDRVSFSALANGRTRSPLRLRGGGLLVKGTPLPWEESLQWLSYVREHGVMQFIHTYNQRKDRCAIVTTPTSLTHTLSLTLARTLSDPTRSSCGAKSSSTPSSRWTATPRRSSSRCVVRRCSRRCARAKSRAGDQTTARRRRPGTLSTVRGCVCVGVGVGVGVGVCVCVY